MENTHTKIHAPSDDPIIQTENGKQYSNVIRVKADAEGIGDEERIKNLRSLAGAIAHGLRRFGEIFVRSIGRDATYKAVKAIIEAGGLVAVHNHDLYTRPGYIMADDVKGKDEMTGICFIVVTSTKTNKQPADVVVSE